MGGTSESKRHPPYCKPLVSSFPSSASWFCHLDDDNYLNPRALLKLLSSYSATWDVYLGKPSLNRPIRASEMLPNNQTVQPVVTVRGPTGCFSCSGSLAVDVPQGEAGLKGNKQQLKTPQSCSGQGRRC